MMEKFIAKYRDILTMYIESKVPNGQEIDDNEIELWVLNDEYLYNRFKDFKDES